MPSTRKTPKASGKTTVGKKATLVAEKTASKKLTVGSSEQSKSLPRKRPAVKKRAPSEAITTNVAILAEAEPSLPASAESAADRILAESTHEHAPRSAKADQVSGEIPTASDALVPVAQKVSVEPALISAFTEATTDVVPAVSTGEDGPAEPLIESFRTVSGARMPEIAEQEPVGAGEGASAAAPAKTKTSAQKVRAPRASAKPVTHKHKKKTTTAETPAQSAGVGIAAPVAEPTREEVARLAYSYWEARGYQGGSPDEDWLRAVNELRSR